MSYSKTFYSTRKWLNKEDSPSTGSVVCYDGEFDSQDNTYRNLFLEVTDCHGSIRLHKCKDYSIEDFVEKMKLLRSEIDKFIEHLENETIYKEK